MPQANDGEMFFYRESVDVDYSMEVQRKSVVSSCVNSYGGEVETFAQHIIKANTIDTLKFLHDESFELRDRFPDDIACMANAHALEENKRDVIDPLISNKEACAINYALRPARRNYRLGGTVSVNNFETVSCIIQGLFQYGRWHALRSIHHHRLS